MRANRFNIRLLSGILLVAGGLGGVGLLNACGGDDDVTPTIDGGSDATADHSTSDAPVTDGGVSDGNAMDADANDAYAAICPIIGPRDEQVSIGNGDCNRCARAYCCNALESCFAGDVDAGSTINADGGSTDCFGGRFICWIGCLSDSDGGGCNAVCDTQVSAADNLKFKAVYDCIYGGWDPGRPRPDSGFVGGSQPASGNCRTYDDGGEMCN